MTTKNQQALEALDNVQYGLSTREWSEADWFLYRNKVTIRAALKLADKMQRGEVDQEALSNPARTDTKPTQDEVKAARDYIINYGLEPSGSFSGFSSLHLAKMELTIRTCLTKCLEEE